MFNHILLQVEEGMAHGGSPWLFWVLLILILGGFLYLILARPFRSKEGDNGTDAVSSVNASRSSEGAQEKRKMVQSNQTIINVNNGSHLSGFGKGLIIYGIWFALNLTCLLAKGDPSYGSTQLRDAYFWPFGRSDIFYYGNYEFVVYAIALPIIIGLIYWAYKRNK